jgi:ATP-binding cassette subfamily B protein
MTLFVLAAAVPAFVCQISLSRRRAIAVGRVITKLRRESFYSNLLHSPSAAKEIRLFDLGTLLRGRMLHERKEANAVDRALDVRRVRMELVLQTASAVTTAAGLAWGVYAAQRRLLTIGDLSVFVAAVAAVQSALTSLVHDLAGTHERLLVFRDFVAITAMPPDLPVPTSPIPCLALQSHIELQDVWFRYGDELPWVLRGVTLTIRRGESLGLVGVNGAGKSTLIKLLLRLYDPVRGRILWDGIDIREFDPRALRDRLSAVYQDFERYDFSASDNIAVGDPTAMGDRSRIVAAARHAGADRFLSSLPHGYDTQLTRIFASETEREEATVGVDLSGGQWQRVAVARAFVRGPRDLLILDEPNAGLDAQADHDIHTRVQQIAAGQTSLLVSHRLSAIRSADTIVVLDDGVIAETGDHDSLVASAGRYAQAFGLQASGYGATTVTPARAQHVVGR